MLVVASVQNGSKTWRPERGEEERKREKEIAQIAATAENGYPEGNWPKTGILLIAIQEWPMMHMTL